jgi:hypothetical protein
MSVARQVQLMGVGGSGGFLRLPSAPAVDSGYTGSIEATPVAPDIHPTISADLAPTNRPLVDVMPSAQPTITPQTPQQLAASQNPATSNTVWYILGALALVVVVLMLRR